MTKTKTCRPLLPSRSDSVVVLQVSSFREATPPAPRKQTAARNNRRHMAVYSTTSRRDSPTDCASELGPECLQKGSEWYILYLFTVLGQTLYLVMFLTRNGVAFQARNYELSPFHWSKKLTLQNALPGSYTTKCLARLIPRQIMQPRHFLFGGGLVDRHGLLPRFYCPDAAKMIHLFLFQRKQYPHTSPILAQGRVIPNMMV